MHRSMKALVGVAALWVAATGAQAQTVAVCPSIPATTGLTWEHRPAGDADFCRAMRVDGSEAFAVFIARKAPFKPLRSDRAETGTIDGREIYWYRSEIAGKPGTESRETLIELADGRFAHVSMQAPSADALGEALTQTRNLQFGPPERLSSN